VLSCVYNVFVSSVLGETNEQESPKAEKEMEERWQMEPGELLAY